MLVYELSPSVFICSKQSPCSSLSSFWWRTLSAAEQERILLRETSEPFAIKCIKDIFKQNIAATRAELETAEALTEEIL
jgi:hypothetical protein